MKLRTKMMFFILIPVLLIFLALVGFSSITSYERTIEESEKLLHSEGEKVADKLSNHLNQAMDISRTIAELFSGLKEEESFLSREQVNTILKEVLSSNPSFSAVWMLWKESDFDGNELGTYAPLWTQAGGEYVLESLDDEIGLATLDKGEFVSVPHVYGYKNKDSEPVISVAAPIVVDGDLLGFTGVHLTLEDLNKFVETFTFYETGYTGIISGDGTVVAHRDASLAGTYYFDSPTIKEAKDREEIEKAIRGGESFYVRLFSKVINKELYVLYYPIRIGDAVVPWSTFVTAPVDEVTAQAKQTTMTMIVTSVLALVLLMFIIIFMTRNITKPIFEVITHGQKIANKDLRDDIPDKQFNRKDEVGDLAKIFQQITLSMRDVMRKMKGSTEQVLESANYLEESSKSSSDSANEIAIAIQDVSQIAKGQMQGAEESANSLEEMSQGIHRVAKTAMEVSEESSQMISQAKIGRRTVEKAATQIDRIQNSTNESMELLTKLQQSAVLIDDILTMITDVSEQTNLLALNASIEAARAGEAGRGFTVVAEQIRRLSDETNQSAKAIHELVADIQQNTKQTVEQMEENQLEVHQGREAFQQVGVVFEEMRTAIERVSSHIEDLSAISEEMSAASEEISVSSDEIANSAKVTSERAESTAAATEEQLASVEEVSAAATSLKTTVDDLNRLVSQFKL